MTCDAGSCTTNFTPTNRWSAQGNLTLVKSYNVIKTLFSTLMKGFSPFDHPHMGVIAHIAEYLQQWSEVNLAGRSPAAQQALLRKVYWQTKQWLVAALRAMVKTKHA